MSTLVISTQQRDDATIVELRGSASMGEVDSFTRQTDRLAAARPRLLVLDLSRLDFIASLAIGQIVALGRSIKAHGGKLVLASPNADVLAVLKRCNLLVVLPVHATVDEALAAG